MLARQVSKADMTMSGQKVLTQEIVDNKQVMVVVKMLASRDHLECSLLL